MFMDSIEEAIQRMLQHFWNHCYNNFDSFSLSRNANVKCNVRVLSSLPLCTLYAKTSKFRINKGRQLN